jgi:osmotically-inducible protein OsmY
MKTDANIRRNVERELQWEPSVDEKRIGVIVNDGVVTLTGEVPHYWGRWNAEDATKRVKGVRAIANELEVSISATGARTDSDIAAAAAHVLRWHTSVSESPITPVVKNGWVTLSGKVTLGYLKASAENAIRHLIGVKGITNDISVASKIEVDDVKRKIEDAFRRHALLDAKDIEVKVADSTVTLNGNVHSWQEPADAAQAAWAAPGVVNVDNRITVF